MKTLEKITNIHFDHSLWFNEIRFFLSEINVYRNRIGALMEKVSSKERKKALKKFFNSFRNKEKQLKNIQRQIKKHEMRIHHLTHMNGSLEQISNRRHEDIRDQIIAIRVQIDLLKKEFNGLLNN